MVFAYRSAFSKDYPHLVNASGHIEVLSDNTFLVRLETDELEDVDETESMMMSLFLDFLMKDAIQNPAKLVAYTKEMSDEMDELLEPCSCGFMHIRCEQRTFLWA